MYSVVSRQVVAELCDVGKESGKDSLESSVARQNFRSQIFYARRLHFGGTIWNGKKSTRC